MNALLLLRLDFVPRHIRVRFQPKRHVAHQVFGEHGIVAGPFRYRFPKLALEQGINSERAEASIIAIKSSILIG